MNESMCLPIPLQKIPHCSGNGGCQIIKFAVCLRNSLGILVFFQLATNASAIASVCGEEDGNHG